MNLGKSRKGLEYASVLLFFLWVSCTDNKDICKKYLQKNYLDTNIAYDELFKAGKINEAIAAVEGGIEKDSNNYIALSYWVSYHFAACGKDACSEEQLKKLYDVNAKTLQLCDDFRLGYANAIELLSLMSWTKCKNDRQLIEYLEIYNSRFKKKAHLQIKGGLAYFRLGKIEEALVCSDEALALDSTEALAYVIKGKCSTSRKEHMSALSCFDKALSLNDTLSIAYHDRGVVYNEIGLVAQAIRDFEVAIALYKDRWESYVSLGFIEVNRNNLPEACAYFHQAKAAFCADQELLDEYLKLYCRDQRRE